MNGTTNFVRVNVSLPIGLVKELKEKIPARGVSRFIADAAMEKIVVEKRRRALRELLEAPPSFTDIRDSSVYIRKMRRLDEKRLKRLGI